MAYPGYVLTRIISVGGAMVLESSDLLKVRVTITASRSLIWDATGYRFENLKTSGVSSLGGEVQIVLPRTDVAGWKDSNTGAIIDVSAPEAYTHRYIALIEFLDTNDAPIGVAPRTIGPFVLPQGDGSVVDLDKLVPTSSTAGDSVSVPDWWTAQVAAAEAAATAAAAALDDLDPTIAGIAADPTSAFAIQQSATFVAQAAAPELIRDTIGTALVAGANVTVTVNDAGDTITIAATGGGGGGITTEEAVDAVAAALTEGSGIDVTYNDGAGTITLAVTGIVVRSVIVASGAETRPAGADVVIWIDPDELGAANALATDPIIVPGAGGGGGGDVTGSVSLIVTVSGETTIAASDFLNIPFQTVVENIGGGAYNTGTGVFTVPSDGLYLLMASAKIKTGEAHRQVCLQFYNGATEWSTWTRVPLPDTSRGHIAHSVVVRLSAAQSLRARLYSEGSSFITDSGTDTRMSVTKLSD